MASVELLRFGEEHLATLEPWFDDAATQRYLGGREWIRRELSLISAMTGQRFRDKTIVLREGWVAADQGEAVAFVGVEVYDDDTASASVVVAPVARGRGVAGRALAAMAALPEFRRVRRYEGGIEVENIASQRALQRLGATVSTTPDEEGILAVTFEAKPQRWS